MGEAPPPPPDFTWAALSLKRLTMVYAINTRLVLKTLAYVFAHRDELRYPRLVVSWWVLYIQISGGRAALPDVVRRHGRYAVPWSWGHSSTLS